MDGPPAIFPSVTTPAHPNPIQTTNLSPTEPELSWFRLVLLPIGYSLLGVALFFGTDWLLNAYRLRQLPKNFATVKPAVLYRSGQMNEAQFREVLTRYGIRTVVCLNPRDQDFEAPLCQALGCEFVAYQMPGSGQGAAHYFHELLDLYRIPQRRPILVHCNAGAYRTGAAIGLYRLVYDGWELSDVVAEMKYFGYQGQRDLVDHIRQVYETIPVDFWRHFRGDGQPETIAAHP